MKNEFLGNKCMGKRLPIYSRNVVALKGNNATVCDITSKG